MHRRQMLMSFRSSRSGLMPGPTSVEARRRASRKAFERHAARALIDPTTHPLRLARIRHGFTIDEVAGAASLSSKAVARIERRESPGTRNSRARLAAALGADQQGLFGRWRPS